MKNRIKRMVLPLWTVFFSLVGILLISSPIFAAETKSGINYSSTIKMDINSEASIYLRGYKDGRYSNTGTSFKIEKATSSSSQLKLCISGKKGYDTVSSVDLYAKKEGSYTVTIKVKTKTKSEQIKVKVIVGDTNPIKGITIDGKKLTKEDGEGYSFYSEKSSGKMKVTPTSGYEITKIKVCGNSKEQELDFQRNRIPHYYFGARKQTVKNGGKVQLNNEAKGLTAGIEIREDSKPVGNGERYPYYLSEEEYDLTLAMSRIEIFYRVKGTKDESLFQQIKVYTRCK